ncbi:uncharacterized protein LOC100679649 isoform X1 [Nasonia vitripennis]|uniref:C2H2-type domain-containing protein n=1 Tax=Nasonia vitripennis TaxID=7425 RepID=A0A7M7H5W9_NASVI|nr:uncharacterized protein LOC100679649 isoform X1 [Nasonia vitripennis]XP_008206027.1 uncharacterized protein LOC100679649 isoform X1 [Nasonia vitripennis]
MVEGVIMASATMSSVPLQSTKAVPSSAGISKVLLTGSVRRLFNQPNIVIHAIPRNNSPTAFKMVSSSSYPHNKSEINGEYQLPDKPGVSIQVINPSNEKDDEEEYLLPSKNNGKSEILLVPIVRKRKACGHFEPCESLVITPLISINITEDEIDAKVTRHCQNKKCDALSIDHDRCRRASIRLHHCDKFMICDTCEITFKTCKARLNHKKCRRKRVVDYQHINVNPNDVKKIRMRERELQMSKELELKRRSMMKITPTCINQLSILKGNDELIITPILPPKTSLLNFIPANNNNSNINNNNNSIKEVLGNKRKHVEEIDMKLTSEKISEIILTCKKTIDSQKQNEKLGSTPLKQIKLADHLNGATVNIRDTPNIPNQPCIKLTEMSTSSVDSVLMKNQQQKPQIVNTDLIINNLNATEQEPVANVPETEPDKTVGVESLKQLSVNNWVMSSQSFATPYKVVPIAELKSEPSMLHHTQGLPKFCVVPDSDTPPKSTARLVPQQMKKSESKLAPKLPKTAPKVISEQAPILNSGKFRPLQPALAGNVRNVEEKLTDPLLNKAQKRRRRKKNSKKGKFSCSVCSKKFSSSKYCEQHEKSHSNSDLQLSFFCKICDKGFPSKLIMNKHIVGDHKPGQVRCEMCDEVLPSLQELLKHMKSPESKVNRKCSDCPKSFDTCSSLDFHIKKEHGFVICGLCKRQVAESKFKRHLMLEHSISKNRLENSIQKLSCPPDGNEDVREVNLISESTVVAKSVSKTEPVNENKAEMDCIAKNRSVRRRSSKEFFVCTVCERRFEYERQYSIHLATNPMKFTLCPNCGRKFHKKTDYTEHSKTCPRNTLVPVNTTPKGRKSSAANEEINLKSDNDNKSRNSIDQKRNEKLDSINCIKIKSNKVIVQKIQVKRILKTAVEDKITNGLKPNSNDCLDKLKIIEVDSNSQKNEVYDVIDCDDKEDLLLSSSESLQTNSNGFAEFDNSMAVSSIHQDHNYQAVQ